MNLDAGVEELLLRLSNNLLNSWVIASFCDFSSLTGMLIILLKISSATAWASLSFSMNCNSYCYMSINNVNISNYWYKSVVSLKNQ